MLESGWRGLRCKFGFGVKVSKLSPRQSGVHPLGRTLYLNLKAQVHGAGERFRDCGFGVWVFGLRGHWKGLGARVHGTRQSTPLPAMNRNSTAESKLHKARDQIPLLKALAEEDVDVVP